MRLRAVPSVALALALLAGCPASNPDLEVDGGDGVDAPACACAVGTICNGQGVCTRCGNGALDFGETCDPGMNVKLECSQLGYAPGFAGCSDSCEWETEACTPLATCGNGQIDTGELCDGALTKPGLTCNAYGGLQGTLTCKPGCGIDASDCHSCGNGKIEAHEVCDDGDTSGGDGCSATCTVEPGYTCIGGVFSTCTPTCGDGKILGSETCDDGDDSGGDGCSASCKIETDCTCSGTPSVCSCASVQTIWTLPQYQYVDTADITLDGNGKPIVAYMYGINFTDPQTNYSREHAHLVYAARGASAWTTGEVQTWDQTQTSFRKEDLELVYDNGGPSVYFHRIYDPNGTFAVGTRSTAGWTFAYDSPYYVRDVVRGGGEWHTLGDISGFTDLHYRAGAPGAWTKDEQMTGFSVSDNPKLVYASNGDVYVATLSQGASYGSFTTKLSRRTGPNAWAQVYSVTTMAPAVTGTCVFPISHDPMALANGGVMTLEHAFDKTGKRWLRAHVKVGTTWVVEDAIDLSWLSSSCTTGGASYSNPKVITGVDTSGNPHIVLAAAPATGSTKIEDHYRDGTGWHVRMFPLPGAAPLDMTFDATGTMHLLAMTSQSGTTRLAYVQIGQTKWQ